MFEFPKENVESEEKKLLRTTLFTGLAGLYPHEELGQGSGQYFFQARLRVNEQTLAGRFEEFTQDTGIRVSEGAQELTKTIISLILSDPHPCWAISPEERVRAAQRYISGIPDLMSALVNDENIEEEITAFDLLHWISQDKDLARICIIEKRAR